MREIKYRAWDKVRKEMRQVQLMDWSDWWVSTAHTYERENSLKYGERNSFRHKETDRHILMQYTGLKDISNKEIYEGDILEFEVFDGLSYVNGKLPVEFINGAFRLALEHPVNDYINNGEVEVLGNIYENSDLLK